MKHLGRFLTVTALSLLFVIISACTSNKQSGQPSTQTSPQPATSPAPTAGATGTSFQRWKNSQVIDAFKAAGLEIEDPRPMNKPKDYGPIPMSDLEGTQFNLPSSGEGAGGHIYSFASEGYLERMVKYYADMSADNFSWVLVKDNILVQIDGRLPEEKAKQYEAALGNLK